MFKKYNLNDNPRKVSFQPKLQSKAESKISSHPFDKFKISYTLSHVKKFDVKIQVGKTM